MWLLKQLVTFVVVFGVTSSEVNNTSTSVSIDTTISTTLPPSSTSIPPPSTPEKDEEERKIVPSVSIGELETSATVIEVNDDWTDESVSVKSSSSPSDDLTDEGDDHVGEKEEETSIDDVVEVPTEEEFQANVPVALHYDKDIIINRDNLIPVLQTLVQASTHKKHPSYTELLKAGGLAAFKTSLKYIGEEKMGVNLLTLAKKLTTLFDDDEVDADEESKMLSEMAEEFLVTHRFKLVLPQSVLLHEKEMEEFMSLHEDDIGARAATSESELTIFMPRQDPGTVGVTTLLLIVVLTTS